MCTLHKSYFASALSVDSSGDEWFKIRIDAIEKN